MLNFNHSDGSIFCYYIYTKLGAPATWLRDKSIHYNVQISRAKRFSCNQQRFLEQNLCRHQDSNPRPPSACLGMTSLQRFCGSLIIPSHWTLEEHSCRRQSCQADSRHYEEHVHSEKVVEHSVTQPCATGAGIQFGLSLSEALQQLMKLLKFRVIFH